MQIERFVEQRGAIVNELLRRYGFTLRLFGSLVLMRSVGRLVLRGNETF